MADKIDQLKFGSTSYDIDLPPDATPSIKSLELNNSNGNIDLSIDVSGTGSLVSVDPHLTLRDMSMVGSTKLSLGELKFDSGLTSTTYANGHIINGNKQINLPSAAGTFATQEWVTSQGYTTDSVSGVNDGTNWTSITINGTTKSIPSGGGSAMYYHILYVSALNESNGACFSLITSDSSAYTASTLRSKLSTLTNTWQIQLPLNGYFWDDGLEMEFPLLWVFKTGTGKSARLEFRYTSSNGTPLSYNFVYTDISVTDTVKPA